MEPGLIDDLAKRLAGPVGDLPSGIWPSLWIEDGWIRDADDRLLPAAAAVAAAHEAFKAWRVVPAPVRGELVRRIGEEVFEALVRKGDDPRCVDNLNPVVERSNQDFVHEAGKGYDIVDVVTRLGDHTR